MTDRRSFPDSADGTPLPPMMDELMSAGLAAEDARFVAVQLGQNGYHLVNPDHLGWGDIRRFQDELRKGQGVCEDGGGFFIRAIMALLGTRPDPVETHQQAARRLLQGERNIPTPTRAEDARIPDYCGWAARGHWSRAYEALLADHTVLRERAEAVERRLKWNEQSRQFWITCYEQAEAGRAEAQTAEVAVWNGAITKAYQACLTCDGDLNNAGAAAMKVSALRRAAPAEVEG